MGYIFSKPKNKKCICKYCKKGFLSTDVKSNICDKCRISFKCKVCGSIVGPGGKFCQKHSYTKNKGKTYKQIYGIDTPKCGYQRGEANLAKRPDIRKKVSEGVKRSYTPELKERRRKSMLERIDRGEMPFKPNKRIQIGHEFFRTKFEVNVKKALDIMKIEYDYEQLLKMGERRFFPDFILHPFDDIKNTSKTILLEVTGSKFEEWRKNFFRKVDYIMKNDKEDKYRILVITYPDVYFHYAYLNNMYEDRVHVFSYGKPQLKEHERFLEVENVVNFDYSHFLPFYDGKCELIHGHSSKVSVKVGGLYGMEKEPWLVDFAILKGIIKNVCDDYDHKLIIDGDKIKKLDVGQDIVKFTYKKDDKVYKMELPKKAVKIIKGASTAENLSGFIAKEIAEQLPQNIYYTKVSINEGFNNTSTAEYYKEQPEEKEFGGLDFLKCLRYHFVY